MTTMTKLLDIIRRNLKSDAVPKPPRQDPNKEPEVEKQPNNENVNSSEQEPEPEEILIEDNDIDDEPKHNNSFYKENKKKNGNSKTKKNEFNIPNKDFIVNTQATGHVVNIVNSTGVHWGNSYAYNLGPTSQKQNMDPHEAKIQKDNLITLLMEAKEEVEYEYMDFVSKNLGKNWRSLFVTMGYTRGRIETFEIDESKNGISEARYKLLLDWSRNADDPSLGHLATLLWDEGEREVVKALSLIYEKNKKTKK
ncbi:death domain-containing immune deficiency protein [Aphomia sociella]